jgi:hypothetical protein
MLFFVFQTVLKMLNEIGSVENIPDFIEGVKNRWHASSLITILMCIEALSDEIFSLFLQDLSILFF